MASEHTIARYRCWYKKLLGGYPEAFRWQFGESMEQTFNDLCKERRASGSALPGFVCRIFAETILGIVKEHLARNTMKSSTVFLQSVIVLIGIGALAFLLWEPHLEGRNQHATPFEIYFKDPFLAFAYVASIPFFVALFKTFKVLGYARQNTVFSSEALNALRTIKVCAISIIGFVAVGECFIMMNTGEDRAGGVFMGILITFGSIVIASSAAMFERILRNALAMMSKSDPTV